MSPQDRRYVARERELRLGRLAHRQHGQIAIRQLRALGFSAGAVRRRVERRALRPRFPGVYTVGAAPVTRHARWAAAVLACGHGALLSHRDAAALWGLIDVVQQVVDVTVPGRGRGGPEGIRRHGANSLTDSDRTERNGIPVTSVARTLLDVAAVLPPKLVQRAYEEAAGHGLLDVGAMHELLARSRGKKGVRVLRRILEIDPEFAARLRSELERMFRDLITASDMPMYEPNHVLLGYEVDAYWPEARLVIELDSRSFHTSAFAAERDDTKTAELRLAGYEVLRITYTMVARRPRWVLDTVRTMRARGVAANAPREAAGL